MQRMAFLLLTINLLTKTALAATECQLWVDAQGIPHIKTSSLIETMTCWGAIHARDRSQQMDDFRRVASGTAAEVAGFKKIKSDFFMRLLELPRRAQVLYSELKPEYASLLQAYSNGVNSVAPWLTWGPQDTITLLLLQSFDQCQAAFSRQLREREWFTKHGKDASRLFSLEGLPWDASILKEGEYPLGLRSTEYKIEIPSGTLSDSAWLRFLSRDEERFQGSNNWVVSKEMTKNSKALLANDPHLTLTGTPFWHWSHFENKEFDVIGASVPGIPVVVSGTNRHVSWGLTTANMPTADVAEVANNELRDSVSERPLIWVRLGFLKWPFFFKKATRTSKGWPHLPLESEKGHSLVLRWTGFDLRGSDLEGLFEIMKSRSLSDVDRSLKAIGLPSWNFVFAETSGAIGYRVNGKVYRTEAPLPFGIRRMPLKEFESVSFLNENEMPHLVPSKRNFIVTANNRHWPTGARFFDSRSVGNFRGFRIEELLGKSSKHDMDSFKEIQCDAFVTDARTLLPLLLKHVQVSDHPRAPLVIQLLRKWDMKATTQCRACGAYRRWIDQLKERTQLREGGLYKLLAQDPSDEIKKHVVESFREMLGELSFDSNADPSPWSEVHKAFFPDFLTGDPHEEQGIASPGDQYTVNLGQAVWEKPFYAHEHGPSHRMVVEMASPPHIQLRLAGANRGDDSEARAKWAECRYSSVHYPVDWTTVEHQTLHF